MVLPRLYAIVDVDVCQQRGWLPLDLTSAYLAGGARLLQLRAKGLAGEKLLDLARAVVETARPVGASVIMNDRADLAVLAAAAGVHVGQDDLAPRDARAIVGTSRLVGVSTHTAQQVHTALSEPISYVAIGPVFSTATKATGYEALGYDGVRETRGRAAGLGLPIVAIGGITLETAPRVIEAGAHAVAVITDLLVGDPESRVREYLSILG